MTITADHIRNALDYDPATGVFVWKNNHRRPDLVGKIAGSRQSAGYIAIAIKNKKQLAHRLAWLYMTGSWPKLHIDHINGIKTDNRFENLRDVPRTINLQNMKAATKRNKIGFLGVSAHQGKWRAQLMLNGKRIRISGFDTPEEAHRAYLQAKHQ